MSSYKHVVITGMYRSGTTLLHHLLDGHPSLNVFPVENCIIRDGIFSAKLPRKRLRNLDELIKVIRAGKTNDAIDLIIKHEKLGLPIRESFQLEGSTGSQKVSRIFNISTFNRELSSCLEKIKYKPKNQLLVDLYEGYHMAYAHAISSIDKRERSFLLVNKCPECGFSIEFMRKYFKDIKVIHIIRDPRDVVASYKASIPKNLFFPVWRIRGLIELIRCSFSIASQYVKLPEILVIRYEDLVNTPNVTMNNVSKFLNIPFRDEMLIPSIEGDLWLGNSSNKISDSNKAEIISYKKKYLSKLNNAEIKIIESNLYNEMQKFEYKEFSEFDKNQSLKIKNIIYLFNFFRITTLSFLIKRRLRNILKNQ